MPASPPFCHCWRARLGPVPPAALALLSAAERDRLARFHAEGPRQAYAGAHLLLRQVLGCYAGQPPAELALGFDVRQKPVLTARPLLWFNLSYRPQWALLAVSNQGEVGVDVEEIRPVAGAAALAGQLFSPAEQAALRHVAGAAWWRLFYGIWTRKEAWAKQRGLGLALPFAGFTVATWAGTAVAWPLPGPGRLHGFALDAGHAAALAGPAPAAGEPVPWQHYSFPHSLPTLAFPR